MRTRIIITILLVILLVIFIIQNSEDENVRFFLWNPEIRRSSLILICICIGILIGVLIPVRRAKSAKEEKEEDDLQGSPE